ncbi:hypothetical protein V5O48_007120 [Marasmius crinis-equi]|uniref:Uncharacterized protein n=1 Tax=Marasmius crinis-equi TaxID=585013 RepID=A0ABR3FHU7_9AGAR
MLITFQETPDAPLRTVELPDTSRSFRIASVIQLLVEWGRVQTAFEPENLEETLAMLEHDQSEQAGMLAACIQRLIVLLERRRHLRAEMWAQLAPFLTQDLEDLSNSNDTETIDASTKEGSL